MTTTTTNNRMIRRAASKARNRGVSAFEFIRRYNSLVDGWTVTREVAAVFYAA